MRRRLEHLLIVVTVVNGCSLSLRAQNEQAKTAAPAGVITGRVSANSSDLPPNTIVWVATLGLAAPPRTALVNDDGTFKIEGLDVGLYRVWTSAPGYVSDTTQAASDNRGIYHTGDSVDLKLRKGGVITGTVLNSNNTPLVNASVRAFRIKDENGKAVEGNTIARERLTDDRGVYRIYGLAPGTYIVSAGGGSRIQMTMRGGAYDTDAPTYAPSSTRDTAGEIVIRGGEEVTGDIQYRSEPGHSISGIVNGIAPQPGQIIYGIGISLVDVNHRAMLMETSNPLNSNSGFALYGIPDGEYELAAQQYTATRDVRGSDAKRIKVQGADITGINLTLMTMPAITGRVILEKNAAADCVRRPESAMQETLVSVRRRKSPPGTSDSKAASSSDQIPMQFAEQSAEAVLDDKGEFILRNLHAGTYRLTLQLPSPAWYLRTIALGVNVRTTDASVIAEGVTLKNQTVSGLTITMTEGAASIRGRLTTAESQQLPPRMIAYLVPAEKESANDLLRFFEARVASDGRFNISNLPPGDYFVTFRGSDEDRPPGILVREDAAFRSTLTREAENLKQKVTLKPCERLENYELTYSPATQP